MNAQLYGMVVKNQSDMLRLVSNDDYLKEYMNMGFDTVNCLVPVSDEFKNKLSLFYKAIDIYAKNNGLEPCDFIEEHGYRVIYSDLILAVGKDSNSCFIYKIIDYDYESGIDFNDIIKYYKGEKKPAGKYIHLTRKTAV